MDKTRKELEAEGGAGAEEGREGEMVLHILAIASPATWAIVLVCL